MPFHHLFEIETGVFQAVAPRPEMINEMIGGDELAAWLRDRLTARGFACRAFGPEDHGWDFDIAHEGRRYRVVSSCDFEEEGVPATRHVVQLAQEKGQSVEPDPLLDALRSILTGNPDFASSATSRGALEPDGPALIDHGFERSRPFAGPGQSPGKLQGSALKTRQRDASLWNSETFAVARSGTGGSFPIEARPASKRAPQPS